METPGLSLLRQSERLASHAPAAVHAERNRQRKLAGGECRNVLRLIVFVHLKIVLAKSCDQPPSLCGNGRVHFDQLNLRRKLRERTFLLRCKRRTSRKCDCRCDDEPSHL